MAEKNTIQELQERIEEQDKELEYYKKLTASGDGTAKSEALKELFDFPPEKLKQRTRLNEKQIQTFAVIMANMAMMNPDEPRTWIEAYMDFVMEMLISLKGKGRDEGMGIFQMEREEKEAKDAYTG